MPDLQKSSGILTKECLRTQICGKNIFYIKTL